MIPEGFEAEDAAGLETLQLFAKAEKFNRWLYDEIAPYCKGAILEIGSGIGNISHFLLKDATGKVTLSDLREEYCTILQRRFANDPRLGNVFQLNMSVPDLNKSYPQLQGRFDTVVALNLIEHIKDDQLAIHNCKQLLKEGGHLVALVPAFQWLYNSLDKELEHYRRYTKKTLNQLAAREGMKVLHTQYFNCAAMPGWWFSGSVLKKKLVPASQLGFYNRLVPLARAIDKMVFHSIGLSVIVVAKK
jgi:2-polyprenyl-3-methyl-5-hydroxy-6-metoxy-1,4-benzoquinol methylase